MATNHTTNASHHQQQQQLPFCAYTLQQCVYTGLGGARVLSSDIYANVLQWIGISILWYYCRELKTRTIANKSRSEVAKEMFLPMYHVYIRYTIYITMFWTLISMLGLFPTQLAGSGQVDDTISTSIFTSIIVGVNWGMYHLLFDFVMILLLYPGFGKNTIMNALKISMFTGFVSGTIIAIINKCTDLNLSVLISLIWDLLYSCFYLFIWLWPSQKISCCCISTGSGGGAGGTSGKKKNYIFFRRPAVRYYAMWWFFIRFGDTMVTFLFDTKFAINKDGFPLVLHQYNDNAVCGHFLFAWLLWGVGWPIILIKTFRRDTIYWSGGFNDCQTGPFDDFINDVQWLWSTITCKKSEHPDYQPSLRTLSKLANDDIRRPLFDLGFSTSESATVREGLDIVPSELLIRFCELSLDSSVILGSGGTARVFVGEYEKKKVAIKLITCFELTAEIVQSFFDEAILLHNCSDHPNILDLYGICVAPPTLCLVLELAKGGDLTNDLKEYAQHQKRDLTSKKVVSLQQFCNNHQEVLKFLSDAIQCTSSVAYLHSKNPPLLHRDIKSMNYLVAIEERNVEITNPNLCYQCPFVDHVGTNLTKHRRGNNNNNNNKSFLRNNDGKKTSNGFRNNIFMKRSISSGENIQQRRNTSYQNNNRTKSFSNFHITSKQENGIFQHDHTSVTNDADDIFSTTITFERHQGEANSSSISLNCFKDKMSRNRVIKLADLGLAGESIMDTNNDNGKESEFSLLWAAPEVLRGEVHTEKSDVFSLIIVFWEILNPGMQPFDYIDNISDISEQIKDGLRPLLEPVEDIVVEVEGEMEQTVNGNNIIYKELNSLFINGWHDDQSKRPTAMEIETLLKRLKLEIENKNV